MSEQARKSTQLLQRS